MKYDTTLGRDQNVELGKESTLCSSEVMVIPGGVRLQEFAPDKYVDDYSRLLEEKENGEDSEAHHDEPAGRGGRRYSQKKEDFEDKMARRKREEAQGLLMPRVTTSEKDGGPYQSAGHMSREYYRKHYNHFGTIGQVIKQVAHAPNIKITDQNQGTRSSGGGGASSRRIDLPPARITQKALSPK